MSSDYGTYLAPTPFEHPDYRNIDAATYDTVGDITTEARLWQVAQMVGIQSVMRWKPRDVSFA